MQFVMLLNWKKLYLVQGSPDFNLNEGSYHQAKDFIRENDIAFRRCLQPHAFCMLLRTFNQNIANAISETLAMSDDSTEVIILNPFVTF